MVKILYFTDLHTRGNSPVHRKDDFRATIMKKWEEIGDIARREAVDIGIVGGDWVERPDISNSVLTRMLKILRHFPVKLIGVLGNHDVFGQNPTTLDSTVLGVLYHSGIIDLLYPGEFRYFEKDGLVVQLTGCPFHYELDRRDPKHDYFVEKKNADVAIHVVHSMLVDKEYPYGPHTRIEDVETEADIVLSGHYHPGFSKVHYVNGTYFANPGSIARLKCTKENVGRMPKVLIIEIYSKDNINFREICLECARPGDEVFDLAELERATKRESTTGFSDFKIQIPTYNLDSIDPLDIIDRIYKEHEPSIEPNIVERARKRLQESIEFLMSTNREGQ